MVLVLGLCDPVSCHSVEVYLCVCKRMAAEVASAIEVVVVV